MKHEMQDKYDRPEILVRRSQKNRIAKRTVRRLNNVNFKIATATRGRSSGTISINP